jgi:transposase
MATVEKGFARGKEIYVGIDVHKKDWTVHVLCEGEAVKHCTMAAECESLIVMLKRFDAAKVHTVYEAGPTGYWLHEALISAGFDSRVTPPSLVPRIPGSRVKTDHRDCRKLATLLASGFLKSVHVLNAQERAHRQLLRTRNQLERHRKQTQAQIKSMLLFHGKKVPTGLLERWSEGHVQWLERLEWEYPALAVSMKALVALFRYLDTQLKAMDGELEAVAQTEKYRDRVGLLMQIPGLGLYSAMTILVELQDVERFRRADQLASYLGLTPSQHSSGQRVRIGEITRCGNVALRSRFVESSWTLIRYDMDMRRTYERIKHQTGSGKKAIVAIARRLALRVRRILLEQKGYHYGNGSTPVYAKDKARAIRRYVLHRTQTA